MFFITVYYGTGLDPTLLLGAAKTNPAAVSNNVSPPHLLAPCPS